MKQFFKNIAYKVKAWFRYRQKMKELRKRDPYIYK